MANSNRQVISVSELNKDARRLLESEFPMLLVEGEISNLAQPGSGHWYFTLKDDKAQVRCAMFRNRNHMVRFKPRNGQQIIVRGRISLYENRGEFQLIAEFLEDSGDGALRRAFEKLKASLQAEGLFDEAKKKPIPELPQHIAIVTSPAGAAVRDVIAVMQRRFPAIRISILPVQVQGEESVPQIVAALDRANKLTSDPFDLVMLTRGGGSLEDLWSFNTEPVARAIAASELPVICAVGHESDVSIADFVADLRAPTPSAAAELITPDGAVLADEFRNLARRLYDAVQWRFEDNRRELIHLGKRLRHPSSRLDELAQRLDDIERRLTTAAISQQQHKRAQLERSRLPSPQSMIASNQVRTAHLREKLTGHANTRLAGSKARLSEFVARLNTLNPLATLERGYAIVTTEPGDHVITDAGSLKKGDLVRGRLKDGSFIAEVK